MPAAARQRSAMSPQEAEPYFQMLTNLGPR
jgi:hypothetical protein